MTDKLPASFTSSVHVMFNGDRPPEVSVQADPGDRWTLGLRVDADGYPWYRADVKLTASPEELLALLEAAKQAIALAAADQAEAEKDEYDMRKAGPARQGDADA